ncbi:MAG: ABC transporter permease [Ignavibacterium sp.]
MNKALTIAKWEYSQKVKTKTFILSIFITPIIIILFAYLPSKLASEDSSETKAIGLLDYSNEFANPMIKKLSQGKLKNEQPRFVIANLYSSNKNINELKIAANQKVLNDELEAYILINRINNDSIQFEFRSKNIGNFGDLKIIEDSFNEIKKITDAQKIGADEKFVSLLTKNIELKVIEVKEEGKEGEIDFMGKFMFALIFIILMMTMIVSTGGMLVRSLVEEKSNRLIEIIISSCSPNDLLLGKVIGLSLLILTEIFIWILIGVSFFGQTILMFAPLQNIFIMLLYFILGFIFYTSIFVGVGSIVNTEQEAQQITSYLSLIIMLPIIILVPAIQNPDMPLIKFFTYFPFTTPAAMIIKLSNASISTSEVLITILILIASIALVIYLAAKIFRIGILSYGKIPSLKELFNWLKSE